MLQIFGVILRENNDEFSEKGGEGVTPIQKNWLQILAPPEKKRNIDIRNEGGGGGQRPFGLYPKIHPLWNGESSLTEASPLILLEMN